MTTTKMLNKFLVNMIMQELLKDVFSGTFIHYGYILDKECEVIKIKAELKQKNRIIEKWDRFSINNWVNLLTNYDYLKRSIRENLVDNINKDD